MITAGATLSNTPHLHKHNPCPGAAGANPQERLLFSEHGRLLQDQGGWR